MYRLFRLTFVLFILLSTALFVRAQAPTGYIHGTVVDSATHDPLEESTVTLYALPGAGGADPVLLATRRSGVHGFTFHVERPGRYRLIATYLGFDPDTAEAVVGRPDNKDVQVRLMLHSHSKTLMKVVVTARIPPAIVRHDTIAFNADAYPSRPYATIEDLLRKLPGIEVDNDGNITMQGRKVDKIFLDGKEFFLGDPRLATRNLPSEIVDQVEVFDSRTDKSRQTGIREETATKSINIKLKKSRRSGYFGNAYAGTGSGGAANPSSPVSAYSAGGTITSLRSSWSFASANLNNINNQFTAQENRNGPGSGGVQRLNDIQLNYSNLSEEAIRRSLGYIVNAGTSGNHTILDQKSSTQTALTDSSLLSTRNSHSTGNTQTTAGSLFLEYSPDTMSLITVRSNDDATNANSNQSDTTAISTLKPAITYGDNQGRTVNRSVTNSHTLNNEISFLRRGNIPDRSLYMSVGWRDNRQQQSQNTYSLIHNFDSTGHQLSQTLINQSIRQSSGSDTYEVSVNYTEPLKPGHLLDLSYYLTRSISRSDRTSNDYDSVTGHYDQTDPGTTNHFTTYNTIQLFQTNYNHTLGKLQCQIGGSLQVSQLRNLDRSIDSTLTLRQTNWFPHVSLAYTSGHGSVLVFSYNVTTTSPTVQQLQPVSDPTNPFLIKLGNPGLQQQLTHAARIGYNMLNTSNFHNFEIAFTGEYSQHYISTATTILSGGIQQVQYINVNGVWNDGVAITYGFPLGDQKKGNSSLGIDGSYGRNVSEINAAGTVTGAIHRGANWKLNYHPVDRLFIEAHATVSNTINRYSLNPEQNASSWVQSYALDASYALPGGVTVSSLYNLLVTGAQANLPAQAVSIWNAAAYKDIGRRHDVQVRFSVFGLLNTTHTITQTTGTNFVSTNQTNLPGRILLLSMVYHFKKFPGA